jgi:hypothetical protein
MKRILRAGFCLLAITASNNILANEDTSMYLGLGSVFTSYKGSLIDTSLSFEPGQRIDDNTTMLELCAGYQLNPYISFELGYADFGKVSKRLTYNPDLVFISSPHNIEKRELQYFSLRTLLEYPLANNLSIIGLLGYSYFDIEQTWTGGSSLNLDVNDFTDNFEEDGLFYGLGGKYSLNEKYVGKLIWTKSEMDSLDIRGIHLAIERAF